MILYTRHSGLYGFHIMNINNNEKSNYEINVLNPSSGNFVNIFEIPIQSSTDAILEVLTNYKLSIIQNQNNF